MAETEQTQVEETQAEEAQDKETQTEETQDASSATEAKNAQFAEAEDVGAAGAEANLDVLLDISMPLTVNLGKASVQFRRLLQLGPGSVLQLDKPIGEPAELYVQNVRFATGDIVVVEDCFAVKIKEVLGMDVSNQQSGEQQ